MSSMKYEELFKQINNMSIFDLERGERNGISKVYDEIFLDSEEVFEAFSDYCRKASYDSSLLEFSLKIYAMFYSIGYKHEIEDVIYEIWRKASDEGNTVIGSGELEREIADLLKRIDGIMNDPEDAENQQEVYILYNELLQVALQVKFRAAVFDGEVHEYYWELLSALDDCKKSLKTMLDYKKDKGLVIVDYAELFAKSSLQQLIDCINTNKDLKSTVRNLDKAGEFLSKIGINFVKEEETKKYNKYNPQNVEEHLDFVLKRVYVQSYATEKTDVLYPLYELGFYLYRYKLNGKNEYYGKTEKLKNKATQIINDNDFSSDRTDILKDLENEIRIATRIRDYIVSVTNDFEEMIAKTKIEEELNFCENYYVSLVLRLTKYRDSLLNMGRKYIREKSVFEMKKLSVSLPMGVVSELSKDCQSVFMMESGGKKIDAFEKLLLFGVANDYVKNVEYVESLYASVLSQKMIKGELGKRISDLRSRKYTAPRYESGRDVKNIITTIVAIGIYIVLQKLIASKLTMDDEMMMNIASGITTLGILCFVVLGALAGGCGGFIIGAIAGIVVMFLLLFAVFYLASVSQTMAVSLLLAIPFALFIIINFRKASVAKKETLKARSKVMDDIRQDADVCKEYVQKIMSKVTYAKAKYPTEKTGDIYSNVLAYYKEALEKIKDIL